MKDTMTDISSLDSPYIFEATQNNFDALVLDNSQKGPDSQTLEQRIREDANDLEARYQLSALRLIEDDYQGTMDLLLEILRKDRKFRNGLARDGLLAIFNVLGNEGELVERYRRLMVEYMH